MLGCLACGEALCLTLVGRMRACDVDVLLAAVVGCLACCEVQCHTLVGRVRGLQCRCDASLSARLLGMR